MPRPPSQISGDDFERLIYGYLQRESFRFKVEAIEMGFVRLRLHFHEGRMLKPRGRLVVGEVTIWSEGQGNPVAHATGTYAVPRGAVSRSSK